MKRKKEHPPYGFEEREYNMGLERKSPPSVFHVNYRSIFEDSYPAKFDEEIATTLIQLYSDVNDTILDPMAGSGVIPIEAVKLHRNAVALDINPAAVALISEKWNQVRSTYRAHGHLTFSGIDSRELPDSLSNSVDLILTSPPFGLTISGAYDKYSDIKGDLANSKDYDEWRKGLKQVLQQCFKVLKPGKLMIVEIRPRSKDGHSFPLNVWITNDCLEIGFEFFAEYIEVVMPWRMWTMGEEKQRKPFPNHSYLTVFRKPLDAKLDDFNLKLNSNMKVDAIPSIDGI